MTKIVLNDVSIVFPTGAGHYAALDSISLDVKSGERLGLIGKNGAGKSTLLRTMAGIYPPVSGRVHVEGRVTSLFQLGFGMQNDQSGYRNIIMHGMLSGLDRKQIMNALGDIVEFADLGTFIHEPLRTYSQGMAMRLKFACATGFDPEILLLDEWLGAGDEEFQKKASERMERLVTDASIVVFASHNIPLMKRICSRAVWLEEGRVRMFGDIDEVVTARQHVMVEEKKATTNS